MLPSISHLLHIWLCLATLCIFQLNAQKADSLIRTPCMGKTSCHECIQTPSCGWCSEPVYQFRGTERCFPPRQMSPEKHKCRGDNFYFPSNQISVLSKQILSEDVHVILQKADIKLRVGQTMILFMNHSTGLHSPSTVELKDNATKYVDIAYFSKCSNNTGQEISTNKCDGIEHNQIVEFKLSINLKECPKDSEKYFQTIAISVLNSDEVFIIDLEMLCSCSCEQPNSRYYEEYSMQCSGVGSLKCGVCDCGNRYYGKRCECSMEPNYGESTNHCSPPGSTDNVACSGRGTCICNQCECEVRENEHEIISGAWCECDNFSCERLNGQLCNGHGQCDCGQCRCEVSWGGKACEISQ